MTGRRQDWLLSISVVDVLRFLFCPRRDHHALDPRNQALFIEEVRGAIVLEKAGGIGVEDEVALGCVGPDFLFRDIATLSEQVAIIVLYDVAAFGQEVNIGFCVHPMLLVAAWMLSSKSGFVAISTIYGGQGVPD
jgi:hypothetical protein